MMANLTDRLDPAVSRIPRDKPRAIQQWRSIESFQGTILQHPCSWIIFPSNVKCEVDIKARRVAGRSASIACVGKIDQHDVHARRPHKNVPGIKVPMGGTCRVLKCWEVLESIPHFDWCGQHRPFLLRQVVCLHQAISRREDLAIRPAEPLVLLFAGFCRFGALNIDTSKAVGHHFAVSSPRPQGAIEECGNDQLRVLDEAHILVEALGAANEHRAQHGSRGSGHVSVGHHRWAKWERKKVSYILTESIPFLPERKPSPDLRDEGLAPLASVAECIHAPD